MALRVYELARELGISSKELLAALKELGAEVKSHSASLDDEIAEKMRDKFSREKEAATFKEETSSKVSSKKEDAKGAKEEKRSIKEKVEGLPVLEVVEKTTVKEFAQLVKKSPTEIIKLLMNLGEMATINQPLSNEAITILAEEFGYEAKIIPPEEKIEEYEVSEEDFEPRPPVVTVMGHVDHGKTLLLDAIRKTDVVSKEAGGITQHIGAYQVTHDGRKITFIDTPGHEAFTAMRARGAEITDIAVLVVAADDGVMPQTVEAIDHAKAAQVPIVVAINKIDKPNANPEKVKQQLTEYGLVAEEWGGDTVVVPVSAKEKTNLDELLDMILLVADIQELKAARNCPAKGVTVEAKLDRGRGPVATVLIKQGTLRVGDAVVVGLAHGKVRAMINDKGENVKEALPGDPVEVLGLSQVPQAGDELVVVGDERKAREIAEERALKRRLIEREAPRHITLEELSKRIKEGEVQELRLVIKADAQGSVEAIKDSLEKLSHKEVRINVIHQGVGGISETDVMLAAASDAIVLGFNVRPDAKAKEMAEKEKVDLRTYSVIYQLVEDVKNSLSGLLTPKFKEEELGEAEVRATFKIPDVGIVAGCYVTRGKVVRDAQARLVREGKVIYDGKIASLRRFKEDVAEVKEGYECGIRLQDFQDIKVGDLIEVFATVKVERKVSSGD